MRMRGATGVDYPVVNGKQLEGALCWYGRCVRPLATCVPEEEVEEN